MARPVIFVMPFLFVYTPLLLVGSPLDISLTVLACLVGIVAWGGFLEGYVFKSTSVAERILLGLAAACLMLPVDHVVSFVLELEGEYHYQAYAAGLLLMVGTLVLQLARRAPDARARAA